MEEKIITIRSEEETRAFGSKLAEKAKPGMVIFSNQHTLYVKPEQRCQSEG